MYIFLQGVRFFGYHGVLPQENLVGAYFTVDLTLKTDFSLAAQTDRLEGTISYADVYAAVKQEMQLPSQLLEHVCQRIAERLFGQFPGIEEIQLRLSKENPPMGADCQQIGVEVCYRR